MAHIHATRPPRVSRPALRTNAGVLAKEYALILLGAILYGLSTILFVFPHKLLLGGTSGIAVILADLLPLTAGEVSVTLNVTLIVVAFFVLGKGMAIKTFFGSLFTTIAIGLFEKILPVEEPPIANIYLSALAGAAVIAVASGIMFYVDSSSGGTDIVALIVKKFFPIHIGRALLLTDILIVLVGGIMAGLTMLVSSFVGLLVKTLGIDAVIALIKRTPYHGNTEKEQA